MLVHAPAAAFASLPATAEWLDRLGLQPDGAGRLHFAGHTFDWIERDSAETVMAQMQRPPVRLVGLSAPPYATQGQAIAVRCADDRAGDIVAVQRLSALVGLIASTLPGAAIGWLPARLWSSAALFAAAVTATERQGVPPVMHLVGFGIDEGAQTCVTSDGLGWFCGHELRLTAPSAYSAREALRRAGRLAADALVHHGLAGPMTVEGIDKGEKLIIGPMTDGVVPVMLRPPPD